MSDQPLITVLITCYNRKEFLIDAVDSALNQTLPKQYYEILVIKNFYDNGIDKFLDRNNINYFTKNGSERYFLKFGVQKANGQILSFLDDYTHGKMPVRNNIDAFLKKIVETKIEETVRLNFTTRNIIPLIKDRYQEGEPFIFVTSASSPSAPVLGRLYPDTLAEQVHAGAEILHLTDSNGNRVTIALCSALKQLFEQLVDMHTVEQLRRVWRNLIASENAKKDMGTSSA